MLKNNDISIPEACYADLCKVGFFERKQVKLTTVSYTHLDVYKRQHILFLSDFSFSRSKKIYLVKPFLLAPIHDGFLKSIHEFVSGTMLVTGGFLMWFIHIKLPFHCSLPHTVYDDVGMDISGFIVAIGVSNHQRLISRKHLLCKF